MIRASAIRNFVSEFYGCYGISNLCFVQSVKIPWIFHKPERTFVRYSFDDGRNLGRNSSERNNRDDEISLVATREYLEDVNCEPRDDAYISDRIKFNVYLQIWMKFGKTRYRYIILINKLLAVIIFDACYFSSKSLATLHTFSDFFLTLSIIPWQSSLIAVTIRNVSSNAHTVFVKSCLQAFAYVLEHISNFHRYRDRLSSGNRTEKALTSRFKLLRRPWKFDADEQSYVPSDRLWLVFPIMDRRKPLCCLNSTLILFVTRKSHPGYPLNQRIKRIPVGFRYCDYDIEFWTASTPLYLPCLPTLYAYNV